MLNPSQNQGLNEGINQPSQKACILHMALMKNYAPNYCRINHNTVANEMTTVLCCVENGAV